MQVRTLFFTLTFLLSALFTIPAQAQEYHDVFEMCHVAERHRTQGEGRTILYVAATSALRGIEARRAAMEALARELEADSIDCVVLTLYADVRLVRSSYIEYQVSLSRDGLGLLGASGIDTPPPFAREIAVPIRAYHEDEVRLAASWQAATALYPNPDMLSSLSYDRDAVRKHVAKELGLNARTLLRPTPVPLKRSRTP